jgi:hypothetical protein
MSPAERIPELRWRLLEWHRDGKPQLESGQPSADQILQIRCVCRVLPIKLPIDAFETPATAEAWLPAQNPRLGARRAHAPKRRSQP